MKKRSVCLMLILLMLWLMLPTAAVGTPVRVVDHAGLLKLGEFNRLRETLDEISAAHNCDVVIWTLISLDGKDITAYADDIYDANYGPDGILYLISVTDREWAISTCGSAIDIFTDQRQAEMADAMLACIAEVEYNDAFNVFVEYCNEYLTLGVPPYTPPETTDDFVYIGFDEVEVNDSPDLFDYTTFLLAPIVGFVAAFLYVAMLCNQLHSVAPAKNATNYTREGSFNLTRSEEVFLYRNVVRHAKSQSSGGSSSSGSRSGSSTHRSSSGRRHGGSRGRF